jgi:tetratricopeptide (TPR) repeat protein
MTAIAPGHHFANNPADDNERAAMESTATWHARLQKLRVERRLDELDAMFEGLGAESRYDFDVASIWTSVPRVRNDPAEMLRRAEWFANHHPRTIKAAVHLLYALVRTQPYPEVLRRLAVWEARWPGDWGILGPAADIALEAGDFEQAASLFARMAIERPDVYNANARRSHVVALMRIGRREEALRALAEARAVYPSYPHYDGLVRDE